MPRRPVRSNPVLILHSFTPNGALTPRLHAPHHARHRPHPLLSLAAPLRAQTPPQTLFPGLVGADLRAAIAGAYGPVSVLSEEQSKDTTYAVIDRETRDGVGGASGVYTDFFVPFDCNPNCDPSQDVYNNGSGLSQEHTWPRSMGADAGNAECDLHHLFPSKQTVNAARGNLPFGESPDNETSTWYYLGQTQSTPPPLETRDLWSERLGSTLFEPRESREGDVARAMFYFYAVYGPEGTGQASTAFWEEMEPYLLAWHRADTATVADRARSDRVALYQTTASGELAINPFVIDSSLAARAFYPDKVPTSSASAPRRAFALTLSGPNPVRGGTAVAVTVDEPSSVRVAVYDVLGRRVALLHDRALGAGRTRLTLDASALAPGVYAVTALGADGQAAARFTVVR